MILRTILEHAGYHVTELATGATAIDVIRRERPDLILLDIGLPDVDGWEIATRLRSDPDLASVPILVVTAEERSDAAQRAQALAVGLLPKPISPIIVADEARQRVGPP